MIEHLYTVRMAITYNFISLRTSVFMLFYTAFSQDIFCIFYMNILGFEFENIEKFRFFYFIGY